MRRLSPTVSGNPCRTHHSSPGEISSFTCSTFASLIRSPGTTSARAGVVTSSSTTPATATHAPRSPTERRPRCRRGAGCGRGGADEGLLLEAPVVDPDLPQLARAVVDVRIGHHPGLLVDEDDALAVRVLRELGDAFHHPHLALLPHVVEGPVGLGVPLHGVVLRVHGAEQLALADELPGHPGDVAGVAVVAVDVGVLAEERVGALRGGQATDPPQ